jgi:hypothetical protein
VCELLKRPLRYADVGVTCRADEHVDAVDLIADRFGASAIDTDVGFRD